MRVEIQELPAVNVVYLRYKGPFGPALGEFWHEVFTPWQKAFHLTGRVTYGVARDDPQHTPEDDCRYDACVAVEADYRSVDPARDDVLPGGRYASSHFKGTAQQIPEAWQAFFAAVLADGQFDPTRPSFERYAAEYAVAPATGAFDADLFIPVK